MRNTKNVRWLMILALLLLSGLAQAQAGNEIELTRAVIQTERQAVVAATLGLSDSEGEAFWPLYRAFRGDMALIGDRRVKLITDYAENWENLSASAAGSMLDEALDIETDMLKAQKKHMKQLRKVLTPIQAARFYQVEHRMDTVIDLELSAGIPLIR